MIRRLRSVQRPAGIIKNVHVPAGAIYSRRRQGYRAGEEREQLRLLATITSKDKIVAALESRA